MLAMVGGRCPEDQASREFWSALLRLFGGTGISGQDHRVAWAKKAGVVVRNPLATARLIGKAQRLLRREGLGISVLWKLLRGHAKGINLVMHNFMSADELAQPGSEVTSERLAACSFRGAVKRNGEWIAEPMCTTNVEHREALYAEQIVSLTDSRAAVSSDQ